MQIKTSKYSDCNCRVNLISILVQDSQLGLPEFKTDFNIVEIKEYLKTLETLYQIESIEERKKREKEEIVRRKIEDEKKLKEAEKMEKLKLHKEVELKKNECEIIHKDNLTKLDAFNNSKKLENDRAKRRQSKLSDEFEMKNQACGLCGINVPYDDEFSNYLCNVCAGEFVNDGNNKQILRGNYCEKLVLKHGNIVIRRANECNRSDDYFGMNDKLDNMDIISEYNIRNHLYEVNKNLNYFNNNQLLKLDLEQLSASLIADNVNLSQVAEIFDNKLYFLNENPNESTYWYLEQVSNKRIDIALLSHDKTKETLQLSIITKGKMVFYFLPYHQIPGIYIYYNKRFYDCLNHKDPKNFKPYPNIELTKASEALTFFKHIFT